jgi:hypothetical protein
MFHKVFKKSWFFWVNVEKYGLARQATDDNKILRLQCACWITKATDSHSDYVTFISLPRQHWLRECAKILRLYGHWLSCYIFVIVLLRFFAVFAINHYCIFCVIAHSVWMLHVQCSAHLAVYCLHFQGRVPKKMSYQQVRDLVGTTVWKQPPTSLCLLVTKLSFLLILMNILLKNYIPRLLLISRAGKTYMIRDIAVDMPLSVTLTVLSDVTMGTL